MSGKQEILNRVRQSAAERILFLPHAVRQMSLPDRMISTAEVRQTIESGDLVEDYPDDPRGHSCLILSWTETRRPLHVVCAPKEDYLAVITAYVPNSEEWEDDFKKRKQT